MRKSWILAGLCSALLLTAAEGWPSWLDWLFGRRERTRPAIERTKVTVQRVCAEDNSIPAGETGCLSVLLVNEQYTIRWTTDGNGSADSLLAFGTATGQPVQVRNSAQPQFPVTVSFAWIDPTPGNTITTQACAKVKRRALYSPQNCSASRSYSAPDVPPPPPVIDTMLLVSRIDLAPDTFRVYTPGSVGIFDQRLGRVVLASDVIQEFCIFLQFPDSQYVMRTNDQLECAPVYAGRYPAAYRQPSIAQQVVADTTCFTIEATRGTISSNNPCDTVASSLSVGNLQRLVGR